MSDVRSIHAIRQAVEKAENAFDVEAMAALLEDDVVMMVPDYPVQEGKSAVVQFSAALFEFFRQNLNRRIIYTSAEVSVSGDFAYDRGTFRFDVKEIGETGYERVTGKYLWVLKRRGAAGWKIARLIISRDDPEDQD